MKPAARILTIATAGAMLGTAFGLPRDVAGKHGDKPPGVRERVLLLAAAVEKKDQTEVKRQVDALSRRDLFEVERMFRIRLSGGLGFGEVAGDVPGQDGIEIRMIRLAKRLPKPEELPKDSEALARAAYVIAGIAEVTKARAEKEGQGNPKVWRRFAQDMHQQALGLAEAARAKDADKVKAAAEKLNAACVDCHIAFRK